MIESNIIKKFIVKSFLENNQSNLSEITAKIMLTLSLKFFINETVIVKKTGKIGKIVVFNQDKCIVLLLPDTQVQLYRIDLKRKNNVTYEDVLYFLERITQNTAFGRILIENVFEKISNPGFWNKKESFEKQNLNRGARTKAKEIEKKESEETYVQEFSGAMKYTNKSKKTEIAEEVIKKSKKDLNEVKKVEDNIVSKDTKMKKLELNILKLDKLTIKNYKDSDLKSFIKIYQFIHSFKGELKIKKLTMSLLGKALFDQEYTNELTFEIHSSLITIIENEAKLKGDKFYDMVLMIVNHSNLTESENIVQVAKKRCVMTLENWKTQTNIFISNMAKGIDDNRILVFFGIFKKNSLKLRLSFLLFLINIVTMTNQFREFVDLKQQSLKTYKMKYEKIIISKKKNHSENQNNIKKNFNELKEIKKKISLSTLKLHVGNYKDYQIFVMENELILRHGNEFYYLKKDDIPCILNGLDVSYKQEKTTFSNLKSLYEVFYE